MSLVMEKLEGVKLRGSKLVAACPACRELGADKSADHLVIYSDGRFGCAVHPKDELHRRRIWWLAGDREALPDAEGGSLSIRSKSGDQITVVRRVSFRARAASKDQLEENRFGTDATADSGLAEKTDAPACPLSPEESIQGTDGTAKSDIVKLSKHQKGTKGSNGSKNPARSDPAVGGVPEHENLLNGKAAVPSVPNLETLLRHGTGVAGVPKPVVTRSRDDLGWIAADLATATRVALDVETYGSGKGDALDPWKGEIRLLTLSRHNGPLWTIDLMEVGYDLGPLAPILEKATVIAHNAKFDLLWLRARCGLNMGNVICTLTAARLLTAGLKPDNRLDSCLKRYLDVPPGDDHSRSDWGTADLTEDQLTYAARDVAHLHELAGVLEHQIEINALEEVWELEKDLLPYVVEMEAAGIAVDVDRLTSIRDASQAEAEDCSHALREALGKPDLNPASPVQLLPALREKGLPLDSTREEDLKAHDDGHLVPLLLSYRTAQKRAQQAVSLLEHVQTDGRIHGRFEPTGTATGRFSSKEPNLQNVGRGELRQAFIAPEGRRLVVADYSQIELRAAAAIAEENRMIEAYQAGKDLHSLTASTVLGKAEDEVTKEDRQTAKSCNFGLIYGQSAPGLMRYAATSYGVHLSKKQAQEIRGAFFRTFSKIRQWHSRRRQDANFGAKEIRTRLGRRRLIPGIASSWERFTALVNMPVQGGTADGMKRAIILVAQRIPEDALLVATVHDELVVECREENAEAVKEILTKSMTEAMGALFPEVPVEVEANICSNWGEK